MVDIPRMRRTGALGHASINKHMIMQAGWLAGTELENKGDAGQPTRAAAKRGRRKQSPSVYSVIRVGATSTGADLLSAHRRL